MKITGENQNKYFTIKTIEVEAIVNSNGQLMVKTRLNREPGKYKTVLILEEPKEQN